MLLKVGELAKRSGLTVRTLHHYDSIDLVKPSARSDAGYRLYNRDDIARLHQVQALQRLGLTLAEIGTVLTGSDAQLPQIIARQLQMLTQQIEQATQLHARLSRMQEQLLQGDEPELADWLKTLELMNMYDKYFTPEELKRLPPHLANQSARPEWAALAQRVDQLVAHNTPTDAPAAREAARDWLTLAERDFPNDPILLAKLTDMHAREPEFQEQSGLTPATLHYLQQASSYDKLDIYEKYLSPDELAFVRNNYGKHIAAWPPLIADAYQAMQSGQPPTSTATLGIAQRWIELSNSIYGSDPDTSFKVRQAHEREPALLKGSLISNDLMTYMRTAFAKLHAPK
ncbi:MAG: MerR family transcriptional regulator [Steroidobacteraceae bacterium]